MLGPVSFVFFVRACSLGGTRTYGLRLVYLRTKCFLFRPRATCASHGGFVGVAARRRKKRCGRPTRAKPRHALQENHHLLFFLRYLCCASSFSTSCGSPLLSSPLCVLHNHRACTPCTLHASTRRKSDESIDPPIHDAAAIRSEPISRFRPKISVIGLSAKPESPISL